MRRNKITICTHETEGYEFIVMTAVEIRLLVRCSVSVVYERSVEVAKDGDDIKGMQLRISPKTMWWYTTSTQV